MSACWSTNVGHRRDQAWKSYSCYPSLTTTARYGWGCPTVLLSVAVLLVGYT